MSTESQPQEKRRCEVCREMRRVVRKVGPLLIKEPCPYKCTAGYAKSKTERRRP